MVKLPLVDRLSELEITVAKARCMANELANEHFLYRSIENRMAEFAFAYPQHLTLFEILSDYVVNLERQICELQSDLAEGGVGV